MRSVVFICLSISFALISKAQKPYENYKEILLDGIDAAASENLSELTQISYFNQLEGDTILINSQVDRTDFFNEHVDTIWVKKVKKPVLGKHFHLQRHYKSDVYDSTTPKEEINDRLWVIKKHIEKKNEIGTYYTYSSRTCTLLLEDVQTGNVVAWVYLTDDKYKEPVIIEDITQGKILHKYIKSYDFYRKKTNKNEYEKVEIEEARVFIEGNVLFKKNFYLKSDGIYYKSISRINNVQKMWYTEKKKNEELARLSNAGHYSMELSKVIKPQSSQIRNGKMTTLNENSNSVTKYSYSDNYITTIWIPDRNGFNFSLENKTGNSIKVEWDDCSYIDMQNSASRIFHNGVKYIDKDKSQPATVVPSQTTLDEIIRPSNLAYFSDSWYSKSLIATPNQYDKSIIGKTVKVLLAISVKGVINEYTFEFIIKWDWDNPELREKR